MNLIRFRESLKTFILIKSVEKKFKTFYICETKNSVKFMKIVLRDFTGSRTSFGTDGFHEISEKNKSIYENNQ